MQCPFCGKDAPNARFCPHCGKQIPENAADNLKDPDGSTNLSLSEGDNDRTLDDVKKDLRKDRFRTAGTGGLLFLAAIPYIFGGLILLFVAFVAPPLGIPAILWALYRWGLIGGKNRKGK